MADLHVAGGFSLEAPRCDDYLGNRRRKRATLLLTCTVYLPVGLGRAKARPFFWCKKPMRAHGSRRRSRGNICDINAHDAKQVEQFAVEEAYNAAIVSYGLLRPADQYRQIAAPAAILGCYMKAAGRRLSARRQAAQISSPGMKRRIRLIEHPPRMSGPNAVQSHYGWRAGPPRRSVTSPVQPEIARPAPHRQRRSPAACASRLLS